MLGIRGTLRPKAAEHSSASIRFLTCSERTRARHVLGFAPVFRLVAPHALRSLAELHDLRQQYDQAQKLQPLLDRAEARVEAWQSAAESCDVAHTALRTSTLPANGICTKRHYKIGTRAPLSARWVRCITSACSAAKIASQFVRRPPTNCRNCKPPRAISSGTCVA